MTDEAYVIRKLREELAEAHHLLTVDRRRANQAARESADLHDRLAEAEIEKERWKDLYEDAESDSTVLAIERDDLRAENARLKVENAQLRVELGQA